MIMNIIGPRRLVMLLSLALLNAALAGAVYFLMIPHNENLQTQLNQVKGQVSTARAETDRLRNEFDEIQKQKEQFEKLGLTGFFTAQDRVLARDRFEAIQKYSRVILASYDIQPATVERSDDLTAAGQVMLSTPVSVEVDALDDKDFYNFMYLIENAFNGYASINTLEIKRVREIDDIALREIGSGMPTVMIKGKFDFDWKTMVPENRIQDVIQQQAGM